jgi:hypothetical protein
MFILSLMAAALAVTAAAGPPAEQKPAGIGDVYLSFGGFLAGGDGASDEATTAYPALLVNNYLTPAAGKTVKLLDLSKDEGSDVDLVGKFIGDYRSNPSGDSTMAKVFKAIADAKAQGMRVSPITVEMGGEDIFNQAVADPGLVSKGLEKLRDELAFVLDELVDAVTAADGHRTADIVRLTYYNPVPDVKELADASSRMNALIRKMARTRGLAVADVDKAFAGRESTLIEDLLPNDEGHKVVAAEIWKALGH